jgi:hypothetical protein
MIKSDYKQDDTNCIVQFARSMKRLCMKKIAILNESCPYHMRANSKGEKSIVFAFDSDTHIMQVQLTEAQIERAYKQLNKQ